MPPLTFRQRLGTVGRNFAFRFFFVAAVVALTLLQGISILASLVIVSSIVFFVSSVDLLTAGKNGDVRPPGDPAGDRFPRRPLPFRPTTAVKRPLPESWRSADVRVVRLEGAISARGRPSVPAPERRICERWSAR